MHTANSRQQRHKASLSQLAVRAYFLLFLPRFQRSGVYIQPLFFCSGESYFLTILSTGQIGISLLLQTLPESDPQAINSDEAGHTPSAILLLSLLPQSPARPWPCILCSKGLSVFASDTFLPTRFTADLMRDSNDILLLQYLFLYHNLKVHFMGISNSSPTLQCCLCLSTGEMLILTFQKDSIGVPFSKLTFPSV